MESGNGSVSVSRKKGFSCSECMETETRFRFQTLMFGNGNTFPFPEKNMFCSECMETETRFRFQTLMFGNGNTFPFPEKNMFQLSPSFYGTSCE